MKRTVFLTIELAFLNTSNHKCSTAIWDNNLAISIKIKAQVFVYLAIKSNNIRNKEKPINWKISVEVFVCPQYGMLYYF